MPGALVFLLLLAECVVGCSRKTWCARETCTSDLGTLTKIASIKMNQNSALKLILASAGALRRLYEGPLLSAAAYLDVQFQFVSRTKRVERIYAHLT